MELLTLRLILREFRETDFASFCELETHPVTYHYETSSPDEAAIRQYLGDARNDVARTPRTRYRFAVTLRSADDVCGRVTLSLMNDSIREWEIGWAFHPDAWGRGLATESAHCVLDFAFTELNAHRVVAFSHAQNAASLRVMQKLGMRQEGLLRETRLWQDNWSDEVVYAILEREFILAPT